MFSDVAKLRSLVTGVGEVRVLALGEGAARLAADAAAWLPVDGVLFVFEQDASIARQIRARVTGTDAGARVHVMVGAPERLLHKVAGPFDVIVGGTGTSFDGPSLVRMRALLKPGGVVL